MLSPPVPLWLEKSPPWIMNCLMTAKDKFKARSRWTTMTDDKPCTAFHLVIPTNCWRVFTCLFLHIVVINITFQQKSLLCKLKVTVTHLAYKISTTWHCTFFFLLQLQRVSSTNLNMTLSERFTVFYFCGTGILWSAAASLSLFRCLSPRCRALWSFLQSLGWYRQTAPEQFGQLRTEKIKNTPLGLRWLGLN